MLSCPSDAILPLVMLSRPSDAILPLLMLSCAFNASYAIPAARTVHVFLWETACQRDATSRALRFPPPSRRARARRSHPLYLWFEPALCTRRAAGTLPRRLPLWWRTPRTTLRLGHTRGARHAPRTARTHRAPTPSPRRAYTTPPACMPPRHPSAR